MPTPTIELVDIYNFVVVKFDLPMKEFKLNKDSLVVKV